ncbi:Uncharacterised protein [Vibrio cholerae]|nr:Uncharacterised protein [Vibrio cholerae]
MCFNIASLKRQKGAGKLPYALLTAHIEHTLCTQNACIAGAVGGH